MAQLGSTWIDGFLGSARYTGKQVANRLGKMMPQMMSSFINGWDGSGWRIFRKESDKDEYTMEIDNLTVRGNMRVYELIIQKIRAICGSLGISQACGKIEAVSEDTDCYYLTMEGDADHGYGGFMAGDYVRCQRWTESGLRGYWVEVEDVNGAVLTVRKTEFNGSVGQQGKVFVADCVVDDMQRLGDGSLNILTDEALMELTDGTSLGENTSLMCAPVVGDEIVQYGNSTNTARQSAVYIHADEDGHPAVDILQGISTKSFAGCLSVRLGGGLPTDEGYAGDDTGLYCKNGHIISVGGQNGATTIYEFKPTGDFSLGNGKIVYDVDTDTLKLDASVEIEWTAPAPKADVAYALTTTGAAPPTTTSSLWKSSVPTLEKGKYLWTRTHYTYSDGTDSGYAYSVTYIGTDGTSTNGTDGVTYVLIPDAGSIVYDPNKQTYSPEKVSIVTALKLSGNTQTDISEQVMMSVYTGSTGSTPAKGSSFNPSTYDSATRCDFLIMDGDVTLAKVTVPIVTDGSNGKELTKVVNHYAASASKTSAPADSAFSEDFSAIAQSDDTPYIWNYETLYYSDGTQTKTDKRIISNWAADGRSIESIAEYYHADAKATGVTLINTPAAQWTTDPTDTLAKLTEEKPYLWNYEVVTYDKANSAGATQSVGLPVVIGTRGEDGKDGADGVSVKRNLLKRTDFNFRETEYLGTDLNDSNTSVFASSSGVSAGAGVAESDVLTMVGNDEGEVDAAGWNVTDDIKGGFWYVLSFYVRGSGTLQTFVYPDMGTSGMYTYADGERVAYSSDTNHTWTLTSAWVRHYHAFFVPTTFTKGTKNVLFRMPKGATNTAEVCIVRLEQKTKITSYYAYQNVRGQIEDTTNGVYSFQSSVEENGGADGTNSLFAMGASQWTQTVMYQANVTNVLAAGIVYTLSFYVRSDYAMETIVTQSALDTDFICLADGAAVTDSTRGTHSWAATDGEWVRHTYTFQTAAALPQNVLIQFSRRCASGSAGTEVRLCMLKLERGARASDWSANETDSVVRLPQWVSEWNGAATKIGGTYIASPQAFIGEKDSTTGKLTGVLMGARALSIDGVSKTGLYALKDNEVRVAIDPVSGEYVFRGKIIADEGQFFGMTYGSVFKSSQEFTADNFDSYFEQRLHYSGGTSYIIVPNYYVMPTIAVFTSLPEDADGQVNIYLPPYYYGNSSNRKIPSTEDYSLALSLLGTTFVIFNNTSSDIIRLYGNFLADGADEPSTFSTLFLTVYGAMYLTLRISAKGQFFWEYKKFDVDSNVNFNGLRPLNPGGLQTL